MNLKIKNLYYYPDWHQGQHSARATVEIAGLGSFELDHCLTPETRARIEHDISARFHVVAMTIGSTEPTEQQEKELA